MANELIDIYDDNMRPIGTMMRNEAEASGNWHKSIHCWVVRPADGGYVLFQKRGRDKKLFPNTLDITAAGHYKAGETKENGVREILEELGIDIPFNSLLPLGVKHDVAAIGNVVNREFCDVYLLKRDEHPADYRLDPSEVEGLVEIKIDEGLRLFSGENKFARATGVEWNKRMETWNTVEMDVTTESTIPRVDAYYLKIFIMAKLMLKGERYLSI